MLSAGTTAAGAAISALANAIPTGGAIIATALAGQGPGQTQSTTTSSLPSTSTSTTTTTMGTGAYDTPLAVTPPPPAVCSLYIPSLLTH